MVDLIISYLVQVIFIISIFFLYVFGVSKLLPALFLYPKNKAASPTDRGIQKYVFDNGRAIVYMPEPNTKKYITQYILSENNGERFLKCKFDKSIATALYEVTVFDSSDKITDKITVYDSPDHKEISHAVPLPLSAAYVNISVKEINGQNAETNKTSSVSFASSALYIASTIISTVAISLLINATVTHIMDLCLGFTEKYGSPNIAFPVISSLIISILYSAATLKRLRQSD